MYEAREVIEVVNQHSLRRRHLWVLKASSTLFLFRHKIRWSWKYSVGFGGLGGES